MTEKPCRRESCEFSVEVFGEAEPSEEKCLYPDTKWIKTDADQTLECEPCSRLSIFCGSLADIRITRSASQKISFRLSGNYNRPEDGAELYISLRVSRDEKWSRTLILQGPGYLCEAYYADGLTLEISIPKDWQFDTFAANGKSISSTVPLCSKTSVRLTALDHIDAKLCAPRFYASAHKGICLTSEAAGKLNIGEILCDEYIELTLSGYDCCDAVCPIPGVSFHRNYRLSLVPTVFRGKVISKIGDAIIV